MATSISRLDAINYLRKHPDDTVFAAMFHDIRIDTLNEDPIANPLAYTFSCTRRQWLDYGPTLVSQHPINSLDLTDFNPTTSTGTAAWFIYLNQKDYDDNDSPDYGLLDADDVPPVWYSQKEKQEEQGTWRGWRYLGSVEKAKKIVANRGLAWALKHLPKSKSKGRKGKKLILVCLPPLHITLDNKGSFLHVPPS